MTPLARLLLIGALAALSSAANADPERFRIRGVIHFPQTGSLYVKLVTEQQYNADDNSFTTAVVVPVGEAEAASRSVVFTLEGIPSGVYGICAFQDVNGNGTLDAGAFGPKEPWGMYRPARPAFRRPRFAEIAFEVRADLPELRFEVK